LFNISNETWAFYFKDEIAAHDYQNEAVVGFAACDTLNNEKQK